MAISGIEFKQTNPRSKTDVHEESQRVNSPLASGGFYQEIPQIGLISEFLFEMRKDGATYWVGATVPMGTTDFTKAHVFFHPTVRNGPHVYATEEDYPQFRGGWSDSIQRYVAMQGGQLAGIRPTILIIPFMTMAAYGGKAPNYMFATRPMETLAAILSAIRDAAGHGSSQSMQVSRIAVASFSSGIGAMRLFIRTFGTSKVIVETTDFDGPRIKWEPKVVTRSPGAVGRVLSQEVPAHSDPGWYWMPAPKFRKLATWAEKGPHAQIGWMTYYIASMWSVV